AATTGLAATIFVAKSVAGPVRRVRQALARVEDGDLDVEVRVDDGSEVGMLQSGFNQMAAGLRERERLRDLFGRHVGEDVARAALAAGGLALGGAGGEGAGRVVALAGCPARAGERPPARVVPPLD